MTSGLRLVLDFDGVICDATRECALVTWLGVHPPDPSVPVSSYLGAMETESGFVHRFRHIRGFARVLEHFLVAHDPAATCIRTGAQFDALFRAIPAGDVADFAQAASAARRRCRAEEPAFWLGLHTLYPGITQVLQDNAGAVAVVTAKDAASVRAVLERHGLAGTVAEITGECGSKPEAVRDLCARYGIAPQMVTFIDDNLSNVTSVAATGAAAYWATWGYHAPEDPAAAARAGVRPLELAGLPALAAA
jgi:phosphoglycolate phosphatase-like HAD superfamily hydrolase